jgi:hypothetical protein
MAFMTQMLAQFIIQNADYWMYDDIRQVKEECIQFSSQPIVPTICKDCKWTIGFMTVSMRNVSSPEIMRKNIKQ